MLCALSMSLRNWFWFHPDNPQNELESTCEVLFHVFSWFFFFVTLTTSVISVDMAFNLMLFWFCLASVSAAYVFLFIVSIQVLRLSNLISIFSIIFSVIFFTSFSISLVRKLFRSSDTCFKLILLAAMYNKFSYFCKI